MRRRPPLRPLPVHLPSLPVAAARRMLLGAAALACLSPLAALADETAQRDTRPIEWVVGYAAGGGSDIVARSLAEPMGKSLNRNLVINNKPGGATNIAATYVARSKDPTHVLLTADFATLAANPSLFSALPYDPDKDFVPVAFFSAGHLPTIVHKDVPARNLKEFVDFARKNRVSLGTYGAGSYSHVAIAELNKFYGLSIEAVHYRGEAPMWQDVAAGAIHGGSGSYAAAAGVLQSGAGRAIAVPTATRMKKLPDVATFIEQGVDARGFKVQGWIGAFYQTGTPMEIVQKLSDIFVECGKTERVAKILETFGIDDAARDHKYMKKMIDEEGPVWMDLVRGLGLTPQ